MKKHLAIILTASALLILFTACPSPPGIMGNEPMILGGHFLFEQVYDTGRNVYTYNSDGTYEHIGKEWNDTADEWEQTYGSKGTYEYDGQTYTMTRTSTERWGWGDSDKYYVLADNYADNEGLDYYSVTEYETSYFTSNGKYSAYIAQADGSWESESGYSHKESWDGEEQEYYNKSVRVWDIDSDEISYTQNNSRKKWEDTSVHDTYQNEQGGKVRMTAPDGDEWAAGKTITFYYGNDVNKSRSYDETGEVWEAWNDYADGNTWTRTFVHLGDLILEVDVNSSKNLEEL